MRPPSKEETPEILKMSDELAAMADIAAIEYGKEHGETEFTYNYDNSADLTAAYEAGQNWMYRKMTDKPKGMRWVKASETEPGIKSFPRCARFLGPDKNWYYGTAIGLWQFLGDKPKYDEYLDESSDSATEIASLQVQLTAAKLDIEELKKERDEALRNEQKHRDILVVANNNTGRRDEKIKAITEEAVKLVKDLIPMAKDGYKLCVSNGAHQEFLSEDKEILARANKFIEKYPSTHKQ